VEGKNEKNSCLSIRAIRGAFAVRSDERSSCEREHVSSDDLRSVHELHHLNVLLLSVRCHDHALPRSRVRRRDLRVSGSLQFR
jgi:hypothetical protein